MLIQNAHPDNHETRPADEPADGRRGACPTTETITNHHGEIESGRPRQELSER